MRDLSRGAADLCLAGAGGAVLGAKLAAAGFTVVILDAGPHRDPTRDFVSDEMESRKLFWNDERITGGKTPSTTPAESRPACSTSAARAADRIRDAAPAPSD